MLPDFVESRFGFAYANSGLMALAYSINDAAGDYENRCLVRDRRI